MPIITSPPDIIALMSEKGRGLALMEKMGTKEAQQLVRHANDLYLHWHDFRYRPLPEGFTPEEGWAFVKLSRSLNRRFLPFTDEAGDSFSYLMTDFMLRLLNEIDRWAGGNITTDQPGSLPSKQHYIISALMEEAIASSQLEGAASTREVAKEMLRLGRSPKNTSEQMILNNWETIQFIRENRIMRLSPSTLFEIHRLVTQNTLKEPSEAGRLRTRDDIIVEFNGVTVHIPPKARTLKARIEALCHFANADAEHWIHPVIKASVIHFWLAYDHPFTDGNGRTARALMYWYLLSRDYLLFEYLAISRYMRLARAKYVKAYLYAETDDNDLTYFVNYNLRAIRKAFQDLRSYLDRRQRELTTSSFLLRNYKGLNMRQKTVLYSALRHPDAFYTIEGHKNYHGVVYQTARNDLLQLAAKGFLKMTKQGKEFIFFPSERMLDKLRARESAMHGSTNV